MIKKLQFMNSECKKNKSTSKTNTSHHNSPLACMLKYYNSAGLLKAQFSIKRELEEALYEKVTITSGFFHWNRNIPAPAIGGACTIFHRRALVAADIEVRQAGFGYFAKLDAIRCASGERYVGAYLPRADAGLDHASERDRHWYDHGSGGRSRRCNGARGEIRTEIRRGLDRFVPGTESGS